MLAFLTRFLMVLAVFDAQSQSTPVISSLSICCLQRLCTAQERCYIDLHEFHCVGDQSTRQVCCASRF